MLPWTLMVGAGYAVGVLVSGYLILMASIVLHCTGFSILVDTCAEEILAERLPAAVGLTMVAGFFFGLLAGTVQWLILRRDMTIGIRWLGLSLLASVITFPIFLLVLDLVTADTTATLLLVLAAAAVVGLIVGLAQWLVLKTRYVKAALWIPLTTLSGLLLAGAIGGPFFLSATADQSVATGPAAGLNTYSLLIILAAAAVPGAGLMLIQKRSAGD